MIAAMDINLVAIAVGNSRVQVGTFISGELTDVLRVDQKDVAAVEQAIERAYQLASKTGKAEIAAAGVVPLFESQLNSFVRSRTGQDVQWVGKGVDVPMKVATREPTKTGIDRILASAAAFEQLEKACVVVDCGTCVTVNLVNDQGALVGGAILPGVSLMLRAIHEGTASLPDLTFEMPEGQWGVDTTSSIRHGILQSIQGLVKEMAERWASEMGTWPEVIATGGDAQALFADWEIVHAISPDLMLYGVGLAYTNHHIKHGT
jgi:type III pantothenate kinase